jgi:hypothetical protein
MPFECDICGAKFPKNQGLAKHKARKTPCAPIIDSADLTEEQRTNPNKCKFCGRVFSRTDNLSRHMKKACKVAPREGNPDGMEKLYEYTLRKQEARIKAMEDELAKLRRGPMAAALVSASPRVVASSSQPATTTVTNTMINIDNSVGKTINQISINVFGQEKLDRITKLQVFDLLKGLGPVGENVKAIAEKAIIQAAMLIFSDPDRPEDITCYLPNKKGENALIHGETGWEVQPVGLVISPMAAQSIETLFKHQPAPDQHTPEKDVKWIMEECGNIMRYIQKHEGDLTNEPPRGELRGILIRNKELLHQVLKTLPMAGQK